LGAAGVSGERNIGMRKAIAQSKWAKSTGPKNKPEKSKKFSPKPE